MIMQASISETKLNTAPIGNFYRFYYSNYMIKGSLRTATAIIIVHKQYFLNVKQVYISSYSNMRQFQKYHYKSRSIYLKAVSHYK